MDVTTLMRQSARLNGDFTAVITEDVSLTFTQAWDGVSAWRTGCGRWGSAPVIGWPDSRTTCSGVPTSS